MSQLEQQPVRYLCECIRNQAEELEKLAQENGRYHSEVFRLQSLIEKMQPTNQNVLFELQKLRNENKLLNEKLLMQDKKLVNQAQDMTDVLNTNAYLRAENERLAVVEHIFSDDARFEKLLEKFKRNDYAVRDLAEAVCLLAKRIK